MKNNTYTLLFLALAGVLVLFGVNYLSTAKSEMENKELASFGNLGLNPAKVKGIAIEKAGKRFTLNQEQQVKALSFLNTMVPVDKKDYPKKETFDFSRIVVSRFNLPDVSIVPVARADKDIVFDVPVLDTNSYLLSMSGGELQELIRKATQE
ncbi:MAG: hypothetical protein KDK62_08460 [Chlamydiia bacterium]|nr:hypothetical protein [Chlamydiia bacterium]